jgi:sulfur carrier protein
VSGEWTITVNGERRPYRRQTLTALVVEVGLPPERRGLAVAVNGTVVPRARWEETTLELGDAVEIVQPLRGG